MGMHRRVFLGGALAASAAMVVGGATGAVGAPLWDGDPGAGDDDTDVQSFDAFLAQRASAGEFSGAALVARGGRPLLAKGYGLADRGRGVPNAARTRFCICSMGKMFTSVGIARLVERGRLSFGDTIGRYVSGFPAAIADAVTVSELLTHTSGMGDVLARTDGSVPPTTLAGLMSEIEQQPLLFAPGTAFSYSNSGFIVLGAIIQSVSGQAYDEYVHDHVFAPSGMADTAVRVYTPDDVPGMAHGYALVSGTGASATYEDVGGTLQIGNPSGGAYSTVFDMLGFAQALTGHRLLSAAMTDTVLTGRIPISRPGGPADDEYAYGFEVQVINGVRIVGHNGGSPGYEGQLDVYLDRGRVVVILTNQDQTMVPAIQESESLFTA
jgi:CubicO group peptidase (beta-lactamase class C family)